MAHPCFQCGSECYCHGDIDDVIVSKTPKNCEGCGCGEFWDADQEEDYGAWPDYEEDEDDFEPCSRCDGHPACADFGCAFEHGLGHLVERNESNCHEL